MEVDKLLPDEIDISPLVHASRLLWKKWIILKMVFKIPKLERPKESKLNFNNFLKYIFYLINFFFLVIPQVSKDVTKPSITTPQKKM